MNPHYHLKYKICISGAAETGLCAPDAMDKAKELKIINYLLIIQI